VLRVDSSNAALDNRIPRNTDNRRICDSEVSDASHAPDVDERRLVTHDRKLTTLRRAYGVGQKRSDTILQSLFVHNSGMQTLAYLNIDISMQTSRNFLYVLHVTVDRFSSDNNVMYFRFYG